MHKNSSFKKVIEKLILQVRSELSILYDVDEGQEYEYFAGLCEISCERFEELISDLNDRLGTNLKVKRHHGEQRHTPLIESKYWPIEHTWASVTCGNVVLYIDITSSQFKYIYDDIPDYYISTSKPKWYYPDYDNWRFKGKVIKRLMNYRCIKHTIQINGEPLVINDSVAEVLQFDIWGRISDAIHRIFYNRIKL